MSEEIIKKIKVTKEQNFSSDWLDDNYLVGVVHQECVLCSQHVAGFEPLYNAHSPLSTTPNSNLLSRYNKRIVGLDYVYQGYNYWTGVSSGNTYYGQYRSVQGPYNWHYKEKMTSPITGDEWNYDCLVGIDGAGDGEIPITVGKTYMGTPFPRVRALSEVYDIYVRSEQLETHWFATDFPMSKFNIEHAYSVRGKSQIVDENTAQNQYNSVYSGLHYYPTAIYMGEIFDVHDMLISINAEIWFDEDIMQASISQYPHRYNAVHEQNEDKSFTFDKNDKQYLGDINWSRWAHNDYATRKGFFKIQKNGRHVYPLVVGVESVERSHTILKTMDWNNEWMLFIVKGEHVTKEIQAEPHGEGAFIPEELDNLDKLDCEDLMYTVTESNQRCITTKLRHYPNGISEGDIAENVALLTRDEYFNFVRDEIENNIELGYDSPESLDIYNQIKSDFDKSCGTFFDPSTGPDTLHILCNGGLSPGISDQLFNVNGHPLDMDKMTWFLKDYYGEEIWDQFKQYWQDLTKLRPDNYATATFEKMVTVPEIVIPENGVEVVLDPDGNPVVSESQILGSPYRLFSFDAISATCPCSGLPIPLFFWSRDTAANTVLADLERDRRDNVGLPDWAHQCNKRKDMSAGDLNRIAGSVEKSDVFRSLTPDMLELFVMPKNYTLNDIHFKVDNSGLYQQYVQGRMGDNNGYVGPSSNGWVTDDNGNPMSIAWPCPPSPKTHSGEQTMSAARDVSRVTQSDTYRTAEIDKFGRHYNQFTGTADNRGEKIVLQGEKKVIGLPGVFPHNSDPRTSGNFSDSCEGVVQVNFYGGGSVADVKKVNSTILGSRPYGIEAGWMLEDNNLMKNRTFDTIPRENNDPTFDQFSLTANSWDMGKDIAINLELVHSIPAYNHYPRVIDFNSAGEDPSDIVNTSEATSDAFDSYLVHKYKQWFQGGGGTHGQQINTQRGYLGNQPGFGLMFLSGDHVSYERVESGSPFHQIPCKATGVNNLTTYFPYSYSEFIYYRNWTNPSFYFQVINNVASVSFNEELNEFGLREKEFVREGSTCVDAWHSLWPDAALSQGQFGNIGQEFYSWPMAGMSSSTDDNYNIFLPVDRPWQVTFSNSDFAGRILPNTALNSLSTPKATTSHVNLLGYVQLPHYNHNIYGLFPQIIKDQDFCDGSNHDFTYGGIFDNYSRMSDIIQYDTHDPRAVIIQNADTNLLSKSPLEHLVGDNSRARGGADESDAIGSDDWTWYPPEGFGGFIAPMRRYGTGMVENPWIRTTTE